MIDPCNITNYDLTDNELEERLLFWICAAGKNGKTAAKCLDNLLNRIWPMRNCGSPAGAIFKTVSLFDLPQIVKECGIGCYNSKARSFIELSIALLRGLNLRTCSAEDLEKIYGIGMKTSRCFILHSRRDAQYAGLDTHMLKFLRSMGISAPVSTPNSKKQYLTLEKYVLYFAKLSGMSPSDFDLMVWNSYANK